MKRAPVKNGELEYEIQGSGEPVLLIHGSAIAGTFLTLMPEPAMASYQLIRYHRRGFGGSSYPETPFSLHNQAEDAAALLIHLGIRKAHIVGHSYGGATAFQLGLDAPELVHSLIVMEPSVVYLPNSGPPPEEFLAAVGLHHSSGDSVGAIDSFLKWLIGEDWEIECERATPGATEQVRADSKIFFDIEFPALNEWQFGENEAACIHQPTLYMMGGSSRPETTACQPFLKSWIPHLETHTMHGVNHALHLNTPKAFAEIISDFLKRHPL